jgi:hypothetical protein
VTTFNDAVLQLSADVDAPNGAHDPLHDVDRQKTIHPERRGKLPSRLDSGLEKQAHRNRYVRAKVNASVRICGSLTW